MNAAQPGAGARKAPPTPRHSASLIVLRDGRDGVEVLMLRRAERDGDQNSGAAVFPGGHLDAEDRLADLPRLVADGEYHGMQTLDRALEHLAREGLVSVRDAVAVADEPEELRLVLGSLASHASY